MDRYRKNPFHMLGLASTATQRDAHRAADRMLRQIELGLKPAAGSCLPFLPLPPLTAEMIRSSLHELEDPIRRIRHELFWVPSPVEFKLLRTNDATLAADPHRVAVVMHALAIEANRFGLAPEIAKFASWDHAFFWWQATSHDEHFWAAFAARACEIGDARLDSGAVAALRNSLAADVLHASVEVGLWLEHEKRAGLEFAIERIGTSPFGEAERTDALRELFGPLEERFAAAIAEIEPQVSGNSIKSALTDDGQLGVGRHLQQVEARFWAGPGTVVNRVAAISPPLPQGQAILDRAAQFLKLLGVIWHNDAGDSKEGLRLLDCALKYAQSPALRAALVRDRVVVHKNTIPPVEPPGMHTFNGVGTTLYGRRDVDQASGSYIATLFFVFLFIPIWAIRAYRVRPAGRSGWYFLSREPLSQAAKAWRWVVASAAVIALAAALLSSPPANPPGSAPDPPASQSESTAQASNSWQVTGETATPTAPEPDPNEQALGRWIHAERLRLDADSADLKLERAALDQARTNLGADPSQQDLDAFNGKVDAFNRRLEEFKTVAKHFDAQVAIYNSRLGGSPQ